MLENPEMEFRRLSSNASALPVPFKSFFQLKMFHYRNNNSSYLYKIDGSVSQQSLKRI